MLSNDKMAKLYKDLIFCKIGALILVTATGDPSPTALQQIFVKYQIVPNAYQYLKIQDSAYTRSNCIRFMISELSLQSKSDCIKKRILSFTQIFLI